MAGWQKNQTSSIFLCIHGIWDRTLVEPCKIWEICKFCNNFFGGVWRDRSFLANVFFSYSLIHGPKKMLKSLFLSALFELFFFCFSDVWRDWKSRKDQSSTKNLGGNTQIHSTISSKISTGLRTPPEMNKCPLNKEPGPRREMNHLPTINF